MWKKVKVTAKKKYHPAVEAAASYWRGALPDAVAAEKRAVFGQALSKGIAELLDLHEGVIDIRSKGADAGGLLMTAMKAAKLPFALLPQKAAMTVSSSVVVVSDFEAAGPRIIWKAR